MESRISAPVLQLSILGLLVVAVELPSSFWHCGKLNGAEVSQTRGTPTFGPRWLLVSLLIAAIIHASVPASLCGGEFVGRNRSHRAPMQTVAQPSVDEATGNCDVPLLVQVQSIAAADDRILPSVASGRVLEPGVAVEPSILTLAILMIAGILVLSALMSTKILVPSGRTPRRSMFRPRLGSPATSRTTAEARSPGTRLISLGLTVELVNEGSTLFSIIQTNREDGQAGWVAHFYLTAPKVVSIESDEPGLDRRRQPHGSQGHYDELVVCVFCNDRNKSLDCVEESV